MPINKHRINRLNLTRSRILVGLFIPLAIGGGLVAADAANIIDLPGFSDKQPAATSTADDSINYGPPTEQERQETERFKDQQRSDTTSISGAPSTSVQKKMLTVVISSWGQNPSSKDLEAAGFVSGTTESGGTCTLIAIRGNQSVSESVTATPNAQNVSCGLIKIPRSKLTPGSWNITLSYSSATAEGASEQRTQVVE